MPTKKELLEAKTKADLVSLAEKKKITSVKKSMRKDELVEAIGKSRKVKKADL